jgi:hypothetical protein
MSHTIRGTLHFSPLLPLTPDWQALALEASRAYFALYRVTAAVREGKANGHDFWLAQSRMEKAASVISTWSADPDLYGRLLAREQIMSDFEAHPPCANVANNTPHVDCCEQCRHELGV